MKKTGACFTLTMWWFLIFAVLGGLVLFFTPHRERVSVEENRVLQNAPEFSAGSFLSGEYSSLFEDFLSDSIPGRKWMITVSDHIRDAFSLNNSEDMYYLDTTVKEAAAYPEVNPDGAADDGGSAPAEDPDDAAGTDSPQDASPAGATLELVKRDGGSTVIYTYSEYNLRKAAKNIDEYAQVIPDDGHIYLTFVPFPVVAFRFTEAPDVYSGWKSDEIHRIDELTCDKVRCFDALEILEPHMLNGERVFLHVSHQWHIRGAYYVFCEMMKSQGVTPTPYEEYEYKVNRPYNSEYADIDTFELLYPLAPTHNYHVDHIDNRIEFPLMNYDWADNSAYLNGYLHPWRTVETGFHTGRKAIVIGDCFSRTLATFLLPYYDEVHFTDVRFEIFKKEDLGTSVSDMMRRNGIDDIYMVFSESHSVNSQTLLTNLHKALY
jgi:hypothetical protein